MEDSSPALGSASAPTDLHASPAESSRGCKANGVKIPFPNNLFIPNRPVRLHRGEASQQLLAVSVSSPFLTVSPHFPFPDKAIALRILTSQTILSTPMLVALIGATAARGAQEAVGGAAAPAWPGAAALPPAQLEGAGGSPQRRPGPPGPLCWNRLVKYQAESLTTSRERSCNSSSETSVGHSVLQHPGVLPALAFWKPDRRLLMLLLLSSVFTGWPRASRQQVQDAALEPAGSLGTRAVSHGLVTSLWHSCGHAGPAWPPVPLCSEPW